MPGECPFKIVVGPDKALWFITLSPSGEGVLGSISTDGVLSRRQLATTGISGIALGPDNALWLTENVLQSGGNVVGKIGRFTIEGAYTEFSLEGVFSRGVNGPYAGPEGTVWIATVGYIGKLSLPDTSPPEITTFVDPKILWPPNGKNVAVTVRGRITDMGSGVLASSVEYAVADEYHQAEPRGHLTLNASGNYEAQLLLRASRNGDDLDGRQYMIRISAQDRAGNRTRKFVTIIVPHDWR
jgi:hypothetical protein